MPLALGQDQNGNMANALSKLIDNLFTNGFEMFGRYYSCYRGFVVDNDDPESYGRVKVSVPQIYGSSVMNYWAWPKGQFSGPGYGSQCTPQVKEMVWVEFEFGDPKKPIWSYGHFGKKLDDTKEKPNALKDIQNFWFKTPEGHLIEFDDKDKEIRITDLNGNTIKLKGGKVELNGDAEPSVLGDKNADVLGDLQSSLDELTQLLTQFLSADVAATTALTSAIGITLTYANVLTGGLPAIITKIQGIQTKISTTKSKKVSLS